MVINPHHKPKHKLPYVELRGHRSLPGYGVRGCCPERLVAVDSGGSRATLPKLLAGAVNWAAAHLRMSRRPSFRYWFVEGWPIAHPKPSVERRWPFGVPKVIEHVSDLRGCDAR